MIASVTMRHIARVHAEDAEKLRRVVLWEMCSRNSRQGTSETLTLAGVAQSGLC